MLTSVLVIRILLSAILGAIVGIERELHGCAAGLRTHILVSVGSAVFVVASIAIAPMYSHLGDVDPSRIAANIVTGVGFLGAGAIIRYGASIRGLTTAASIWAVAAVGLSAGVGMYAASIVTTAIIVATLFLSKIEERMELKWNVRTIEIQVDSIDAFSEEDVNDILNSYGGSVRQLTSSKHEDGPGGQFEMDFTLSRTYQKDVIAELLALSCVKNVKWKKNKV